MTDVTEILDAYDAWRECAKEMPMMLVQQTQKGECGAACLAMVLDLSLEAVLREVRDMHEDEEAYLEWGLVPEDMIEVLFQHGIVARESVTRPDERPAILTVPSLNYPGLLHYIVWDGGRYLDPSPGPLRYPDDAPVIRGTRSVQWASAIIWDET